MMIDGLEALVSSCLGSPACWVAAAALLVALSASGGVWVVGMPTVTPWTWMLKALSTNNAAMLRLPATRMPAAPASTVPCGATRLTLLLLGSWPATVNSAPIPAPVTRPAGLTRQKPSMSQISCNGGNAAELFGPLPALRSPLALNRSMSPPCSVKISAGGNDLVLRLFGAARVSLLPSDNDPPSDSGNR